MTTIADAVNKAPQSAALGQANLSPAFYMFLKATASQRAGCRQLALCQECFRQPFSLFLQATTLTRAGA